MKLVVKVTAGAEAAERSNQAFTVAAAAAAAGAEVSLWLTGEATWFAVPGRAEEFHLEHATPLRDLIDTVLDTGTVTVCSQCAARRELSEDDLSGGIRIKGATVFVEEILSAGVQALVYEPELLVQENLRLHERDPFEVTIGACEYADPQRQVVEPGRYRSRAG